MTKDEFKQLLDVALEAQSEVLTSKLTDIDSRFTEMDSRFTDIDSRFTDIDSRFTDMDNRFTDMDNRFNQSINGLSKRIDGLQSQLNLQGESLMNRMDGLENEIRYNGVQIDQVNHTIELLTESLSFTNERVESIDNRLAKVEEDTQYIPIIKNAIQNHAKRIAVLEKR